VVVAGCSATASTASVRLSAYTTRGPNFAAAGSSTQLGDGDGCSYSPLYVGQNGASGPPFANITTIRELLGKTGLTIGYVYTLDNGASTIQGNALMPNAVLRRYELIPRGIGPDWTSLHPIDTSKIHERVIACRPGRIQHAPVRSARIERDAHQAYETGRDYIPDPLVH